MQESSKQLLIRENNDCFLSVYSGDLQPETVAKNVAKIKAAFPALTPEYFKLFIDRVKEKGFTNERLIDAVNNVIDNCQYPTPTLANFLSFDKRVKVLDYNEMCGLVGRQEAKFDNYARLTINGKIHYIKQSDKQIYNIPDEL